MRNLRKELEEVEAKLAELEEQAELLERLALYVTRSKTHANTLYWAKHLERENCFGSLGTILIFYTGKTILIDGSD
jgi:hypothetical protein